MTEVHPVWTPRSLLVLRLGPPRGEEVPVVTEPECHVGAEEEVEGDVAEVLPEGTEVRGASVHGAGGREGEPEDLVIVE